MITRRLFLAGLGLFGGGMTGCGFPRIWNPCLSELPQSLANHPLVVSAWEGLDPKTVWDGHVHIAGVGDSDSGITLAPEMNSLWHPSQYVQRMFYLNAGCVQNQSGFIDKSYIWRIEKLLEGMPPGVKVMLLAFDQAYDELGQPLPKRSAFFVPNDYARSLARLHPDRFEWVASIHPYRRDAIATLERVRVEGARAIKWLPPAMGIDPAAHRCQPFYRAMARLDMPLLTHGGEEKAVRGVGRPEWGNPLRLRPALEAGVRVIVAHCASLGEDDDSDHGGRPVSSFALFTRMMEHSDHAGLLFGDISALTLRNRDPEVVRTIIERKDWHHRLLNGSDYPLPGVIPLIALEKFVHAGLLSRDAASLLEPLQRYNPLLFDFVLKRHLVAGGQRLSPSVFATRKFFVKDEA
ncbi:MAG: amidohydrolase [Magnetococcales bacterium]|nr:amidohydrolase [Magnetococcales bacterium]